MKNIIEVRNLSKSFKLGDALSYYTLGDKFTELFSRKKTSRAHEFMALKDVNFSVREGEILGIIGSNGAGKSTLLKILSRITPPSEGIAILKGRVGSLLEVGTGFHQELSGRENIYLNGAILGMSRREINKKFNEIVEFSGVEKFIDTPVKKYSSGMYMRLAFSVATNLQSEILIIDEVLAVGDAEFQLKCLDKINEITQNEGRTVIFVSHNMNSIERLCKRCMLLDLGGVAMLGKTNDVVNKYIKKQSIGVDISDRLDRRGSGKIKVTKILIKNSKNIETDMIVSGDSCEMQINYEIHDHNIKNFDLSIGIDSLTSTSRIAFIGSKLSKSKLKTNKKNVTIKVKNLPLISGKYSITIILDSDGVMCDWVENAATFTIISADRYTNRTIYPIGQGDVALKYDII